MGYKRYIAEVSQSFTNTDTAFSQSLFTQTFSGSGISALTYTFEKTLHVMRIKITASSHGGEERHGVENFMLTPPGDGRSLIEKVVQWGNGTSFSGSFAVWNCTEQENVTNGFWTGTVPNGAPPSGSYITAALHPNIANRIIQPGSLCFITSTKASSVFEIFYRIEQS